MLIKKQQTESKPPRHLSGNTLNGREFRWQISVKWHLPTLFLGLLVQICKHNKGFDRHFHSWHCIGHDVLSTGVVMVSMSMFIMTMINMHIFIVSMLSTIKCLHIAMINMRVIRIMMLGNAVFKTNRRWKHCKFAENCHRCKVTVWNVTQPMPTTTNIGESVLIMQIIGIGIVAIPTMTMRVVNIAMPGITVLNKHYWHISASYIDATHWCLASR